MDPYGTHFQALAAAITISSGDVLELGCGHYSTPLLHELCRYRKLISYETDPEWLKPFLYLSCSWHTFVSQIPLDKWSVVFVDNAPAERRIPDILSLRERTRLFVVHDTESSVYDYNKISPKFQYRLDFTTYIPWTTIFSDQPF
jgi:hypothetical protein